MTEESEVDYDAADVLIDHMIACWNARIKSTSVETAAFALGLFLSDVIASQKMTPQDSYSALQYTTDMSRAALARHLEKGTT